MPTVKTIDELETVLLPKMIAMTGQLSKQVYETLNFFLHDYYTGWTPRVYQRTQDFLHSAVQVKARIVRGSVKAAVYIDYNSMDDYNGIDGLTVVKWADSGLHGGIKTPHKPHVWKDTIKNTVTNGALLRTAAEYLKSKGFIVSKAL